METTERKPRFRKIVRTAGIVVVAVLLLLAGANLWIGRIVRQKIEKEVAEQTGGTCRGSREKRYSSPGTKWKSWIAIAAVGRFYSCSTRSSSRQLVSTRM